MILSLTLNPALDVSGTVKEIVPNEKAYVNNEKHFPGGNGINSGRIAHRLGGEVLLSGFLGGANGEEIKHLIDREKIPQNFVPIKGQTRMNVTVSLEQGHEQTRLSFPGPLINKKEKEALLYLIERSNPSLILLGGSLPPGVSPSFIKKVITTFREKNIPLFLDVPGPILKACFMSRPFFIKPNLTEFQGMVGKKLSSIADVLKEARKNSSHIPIQCISSVEGGALLVTAEHAWFGKIPKVKVQSSVGAGDSMVGAMAYTFLKNKMNMDSKHTEKMLRLGLASSCATLVNKGLTMGTKSSIKFYYPKIKLEKVL